MSRIVRAFRKTATASATLILALLAVSNPLHAGDEKPQGENIDASDPTKIYTYLGAGPKYTDYTNGEHMTELRVSGNLGLSKQDMVFFNAGYGEHSGDKVPGSNSGLTNARARWFHLVEMDYAVSSGYRGWATQIDLQLAGQLKGTDGQNVLSFGALPAFGLNKQWSLYLPMNVVNSWDKKFGSYNGVGLNVSPLLVYSPDNWWDGAYVQFWGGYTRFVSGNLSGEGAGHMDITIAGKITPTVTWTLLAQKNVDVDLQSYRRDANSGLKNDWNAFLFFTTYF
ncbi:MAG TPA: hypothetical protein PLS93_17315 [Accumulibacter sp.]|jgi:hypothetical protein|nr:hypothetical protein [Accumulibacter sp.]